MEYLTKAQKARIAIRTIKTTSDALALRGYFKPSGKSGQTLAEGLRMLSPEIYGSMNDPRIIELKGLEYVIERLPKGIESCTRIILTAEEEFENTSFEKILPPKRRRTSYRVSDKEICFIITRGISEIYDILTHVMFLNNEANKIYHQMKDRIGNPTREWVELEKIVGKGVKLGEDHIDQALWNLSIILGRTFHETKDAYESLEKYCDQKNCNVLFHLIYGLGKRVEEEHATRDNELLITFTPSLQDMIGNQQYSEKWARDIKNKILNLGLKNRPIHIISANLHSIINLVYGYAAFPEKKGTTKGDQDLYDFIGKNRDKGDTIRQYALKHGLVELPDKAGTHIDCQLIDTKLFGNMHFHPDFKVDKTCVDKTKPVILVIDYAFGAQAFEVMDELLEPVTVEEDTFKLNISSISVMGKAGILPGKKGDIMLATAHVLEGSSHNYIVDNDLSKEDFNGTVNVFEGPIVTVIGTSLQNRDLLKRFQESNWKAVGLEMEGGHYQKAVMSAVIRGHISKDVKTRYAYYASDNPLLSGQTLASGSIGEEGIKPTYMITKVILEKILNKSKPQKKSK